MRSKQLREFCYNGRQWHGNFQTRVSALELAMILMNILGRVLGATDEAQSPHPITCKYHEREDEQVSLAEFDSPLTMTCHPACTRMGVSLLHCLAAGDDGHPPHAADRRRRASRGDTLEPNGIAARGGTDTRRCVGSWKRKGFRYTQQCLPRARRRSGCGLGRNGSPTDELVPPVGMSPRKSERTLTWCSERLPSPLRRRYRRRIRLPHSFPFQRTIAIHGPSRCMRRNASHAGLDASLGATMHSRVNSAVYLSFAAIVGVVAFECFSTRVYATTASNYRPATKGVLTVAMLPATATFAWLAPMPGALGNDPEPLPSSTGPGAEWCSTGSQGETCSVGNGGAASSSECSANEMSTMCSAYATNGGPGGRCSAGVLGGGTSTQSCSAFGFAAHCSVAGSDGRASCSATGQATCSSSGMMSHCSTHSTSGAGTACSVTTGSGGSCTTGVAGTGGSCSASPFGGSGHCSSWDGNGNNNGPGNDGTCHG